MRTAAQLTNHHPPATPCPPRSLDQTSRLLAATQRLPVEMRIALSLLARSEPASDVHVQLLAARASCEHQASRAARRAAAASRRQEPARSGVVPAPRALRARQHA